MKTAKNSNKKQNPVEEYFKHLNKKCHSEVKPKNLAFEMFRFAQHDNSG